VGGVEPATKQLIFICFIEVLFFVTAGVTDSTLSLGGADAAESDKGGRKSPS
jgi:hypothetical protein